MSDFFILLLGVILPCLGAYFAGRFFVDSKNLEARVTAAFNDSKYLEVVNLIERKRSAYLTPPAALAAARAYATLSRPAEALKQYQYLLSRIDPLAKDSLPLFEENGALLLKTGRTAQAETSFRSALKIDPKHLSVNHRLAGLLYQSNRAEEASALLSGIIEGFGRDLQSIHYEIRFLFGEILAFLGLYEKAYEQYSLLEKAGKKHYSYFYAKTLKERGQLERALQAYNRLIRHNLDTGRQETLILECADTYVKCESFKEGLLFAEEFLPKLEGKDKALLRYQRALCMEALGDDFLALQEFASLQKELPENEAISLTVQKWSSVLEHPALRRYYTADTAVFEKFIEPLLPAGSAVTRRTPEFYICTQGIKALVFYRRYFPINERALQNLDLAYPTACFRAAVLEILSFSGAEKDASLSRGKYTATITSGSEFLRRLESGFKGVQREML